MNVVAHAILMSNYCNGNVNNANLTYFIHDSWLQAENARYSILAGVHRDMILCEY